MKQEMISVPPLMDETCRSFFTCINPVEVLRQQGRAGTHQYPKFVEFVFFGDNFIATRCDKFRTRAEMADALVLTDLPEMVEVRIGGAAIIEADCAAAQK